MKVKVKNISGQDVKEIELPEAIYGLPMNDHLLHSVVKAYRANKRQGTHATKTRSFVSGSGKKPFRQKGTGNARQGTTRSPNMPGGAVVHGPQPRDYSQKVNKKSRQLALKLVLSNKFASGKLIVIDDFSLSKHSTKHISGVMKALGVKSALFTDERKDEFLYFSARNLESASSKMPAEVNAEDLLRYENLIISENGLNALGQRLGGTK